MKKPYNIIYFVLMFLSIMYIIFFYDDNSADLMVLAAGMFILTSIFTYSNRKKWSFILKKY